MLVSFACTLMLTKIFGILPESFSRTQETPRFEIYI